MKDHKLKERSEFCVEDIVDVLLRLNKNKEAAFPITTDNIKAIIFVSDNFYFLFIKLN